MKKIVLILPLFLHLLLNSSYGALYECYYTNKQGTPVVTSFNTNDKNRADYIFVQQALKNGQCDEILIKKYFFYGSVCNIQFKKKTKKASGLSCYGGDYPNALKKVKEIAKKEYGYY